MNRIPVAGPSITQKEIDYVTDAVKTGWFGGAYAYHQRFEEAAAARFGRRFAIALPSCTSGLHLALAGLGIGPGDEVIVPELTWIATAAPISYVGATPVFADVDAESWCLDSAAFERAITPRTKAAIVVDLYGNMPDWGAIEAVAARHGIALIEDSAEAIGSRYRERPAGSFGAASVFSFHGSKTLTTGEGGMLLTDDEALLRRWLTLRNHGCAPGDIMFFNEEVGFKYRMSGMQAALGLAQLERLDELIVRKREIFGWYRDRLSGVAEVSLNNEASDVFNTYWMVTVLAGRDLGVNKETLIPRLRERGVDVRPFFYPLSAIPAYRDHPSATAARARNPNAYDISPRGVNLPSGYNMTPALVGQVCDVLLAALGVA
jgi:Predicted pyridoxal phosphate-dependent enzyme apparently involved in regulation of cell wall biogenesis